MTRTKEILRGIGEALMEPSEENNLTPITMRVSLYGFLLMGILYINSQQFDATELVAVISFVSVIAIMEVVFKRIEIGKRLIWSFAGLVLMIGLLSTVLMQATEFREAWYRVNVVDSNLVKLTINAPIPIISANSQGQIDSLNDKASEFTGWPHREAKGQSLAILMRPEKVKYHEIAFRKVTEEINRTGLPQWVPTNGKIFVVKRKDGELVETNIEILGFPFRPRSEAGVYPGGKDVGFYAFIIARPILVEKKKP